MSLAKNRDRQRPVPRYRESEGTPWRQDGGKMASGAKTPARWHQAPSIATDAGISIRRGRAAGCKAAPAGYTLGAEHVCGADETRVKCGAGEMRMKCGAGEMRGGWNAERVESGRGGIQCKRSGIGGSGGGV